LLRIFIGYDEVESVAWHTLCHSIYSKSSRPVAITPLNLKNLDGIYLREFDNRQSNSFSFSRFLVPYLCDYQGDAVFMDCDMLVTTDISELFDTCRKDETKAVHVVQHDYVPKDQIKYLGKVQYAYPRKNWSSLIYWNNNHHKNRMLTKESVRDQSAAYLHRFSWLEDWEIGALNTSWNFLVGEYQANEKTPELIHWTVGGPYFDEYHDADYADLWRNEMFQMSYVRQRGE